MSTASFYATGIRFLKEYAIEPLTYVNEKQEAAYKKLKAFKEGCDSLCRDFTSPEEYIIFVENLRAFARRELCNPENPNREYNSLVLNGIEKTYSEMKGKFIYQTF